MDVIQGTDVDIITPFPVMAFPQAAQWMHCYKTIIFDDSGPQTDEEVERDMRQVCSLPNVKSFGIVDKNNLTASKTSPTPLVGLYIFEQLTPYNGYAHVATNRRAWGEKLTKPALAEQAGKLCAGYLFEKDPRLQRISIAIMAANRGANSLATRLGFHKDGYMKAMKCSKGAPVDIIHFGLLRDEV